MKIIKDNEELKSYIVDGVATFNDSIKCDFDICINADIEAWNIEAWKINANNINANNIKALNISYYAFCIVYDSFECSSIKGRRENSIHKCLDSDIEIIKKEIKLQGKTFKLSLQELNDLKEQIK